MLVEFWHYRVILTARFCRHAHACSLTTYIYIFDHLSGRSIYRCWNNNSLLVRLEVRYRASFDM
jgi:hypothetical protein